MKWNELKSFIVRYDGKFVRVYAENKADAAIEELAQKLENVQASMYCDVVDANMENRRLRRALWLARAVRANDKQTYYTHTRGDGWCHRVDQWIEVERKCLKKAEEY